MFRSLALKERPAKTGETVIVWPLGRYTRLGAMMMSEGQKHGRLEQESIGWVGEFGPVGEGPSRNALAYR